MSGTGASNEQSLAHLIYHCPGLHGKGTKQDIKRKTFRELFQENGRLIIPLFQRRYCWFDKTVWQWFEDVVRGKRDHLGIHNSGNLIVKKSQHNEGLIIIDGQQRITTTMLLLSAINDELTSIERENMDNLSIQNKQDIANSKKDLRANIFIKDNADNDDMKLLDGEDFNESRLLPSFCDRRHFFELIQDKKSDEKEISYQLRAKEIFKSRISEEMKHQRVQSVNEKIEWCILATHQTLDLMGITFVEILNDINMAQVFLYLQEKALMGEAALLFNPTPGIDFTAVDLARNLLLAPTMNESIEEQEKFFRQHWLAPIEASFAEHNQLGKFNDFLTSFVKSKTQKMAHVSAAETTYLKMTKLVPNLTPKTKQYLTTYAKFVSLYEKVSEDIAEKESSGTERSSETIQPTAVHMFQASVQLCSELSNFLKRKNLEDTKNSETW